MTGPISPDLLSAIEAGCRKGMKRNADAIGPFKLSTILAMAVRLQEVEAEVIRPQSQVIGTALREQFMDIRDKIEALSIPENGPDYGMMTEPERRAVRSHNYVLCQVMNAIQPKTSERVQRAFDKMVAGELRCIHSSESTEEPTL